MEAAPVNIRDRILVPRARQLIVGSFAVLAGAIVFALLRSPHDIVVLAQLAAALVLGVTLLGRHLIHRRATERGAARDAGFTRMLREMSRSISSEAIVQAIVDELRRAADADHVVVARLRPVDRVVETTLVSSRPTVPPSRSVLPAGVLDPTRSGDSQRRLLPARDGGRTAQVVADDLARMLGETYALSNTLAKPLVADGQILGVLILSRRQTRGWSDTDRRLLAWSAQEMSAALARAFAFEAIENRANVDALTGLPNRRYLEEMLSTVGPRRRSVDRLGALMIDLDHFKRLNDRYGHAAGDRVLRAVGERISAAVRADDTPARYGGEEFAVVLRRANPEQAVDVAERIRQQIGALMPEHLGVDERVSVSIGVAVADSRDVDAQALLEAADTALYRAKREGRNRVVLAR